jgi:hypothetical protein
VTTALWPWPLGSDEESSAIVEPLTPLGRDRRVFTKDGKPWTWKGLSAFPWCDRFARGDDMGPLLDPFQALGYNLLRVWDYVTWPGTGWESQPPEVWIAFLRAMEARGFYVELTLMTDDLPHRYDIAQHLVEELAKAKPPNLVLEIGNEPNIHKNIEVERLRAACEASGFLYASGLNDVDADEWFGLYLTAHTPRDYEWPRKCHDLLEYYNGGGPSAPTDPPHHVPCVSDEPLQPQRPPPHDSGLAYQNGDLDETGKDYRAYFAGCLIMGPGATFHWEGGKFGLPPTPEEEHCATEALFGLSFPAGSSNNGYRRIDEQGKTSRTYIDGSPGKSMVRIRPETREASESGWTPLDDDGILWSRSGKETPMGTRTVHLQGTAMTDSEEQRFIDWLRDRDVDGNISLGHDGDRQLFVAWTDGPAEDDLRRGVPPPHGAVYL